MGKLIDGTVDRDSVSKDFRNEYSTLYKIHCLFNSSDAVGLRQRTGRRVSQPVVALWLPRRTTAVYVANVDAGTISIVSNDELLGKIEAGMEPTRLARAGTTLLVTLRAERSVALLTDQPV